MSEKALELADRVELVGSILQEWGVEFAEMNALSNAVALFDGIGSVEENVVEDARKCAQWVYRALEHGWHPDVPKPELLDRCYFCRNFEGNRCHIFDSAVTPDSFCAMFASRVVEQ